MQKFFLFVLIFILIVSVSRLILRWLFPWLIKKFIERNMPKGDEGDRNQTNTRHKQKDKIIPDDKGEYVDYEEIEEKKNQDNG